MIINIDGFNEVIIVKLNNENVVDIMMFSINYVVLLINIVNNSLFIKFI